jgi:hypothetical protein
MKPARASIVWMVAALAGGGCASIATTLRSNHYRVTVPTGWSVEDATIDDDEPVVLSAPAAPTDHSGKKLELRIYAWEQDQAGSAPVEDVVARLAVDDQGQMRAQGAADAENCMKLGGRFVMFGEPRSAARLRAKTGHHVVVTAATAAGSLVAVVGVVPHAEPFCDNVAALEAAISELAGRLIAVDFAASHGDRLLTPTEVQQQGPPFEHF